jgi:D-alanyl-lipoteichoic acid acyltransferase DltB (MBOAT superfamily)
MLFNSYEFIFLYLPAVVVGFYTLNLLNRTAAIIWLCGASLFFYGYWNWRFVPLLVGSVVFNYGMGILLMRGDNQISPRLRLFIVIFAVGANLTALAYFKYANFIVDDLNLALPHPLVISTIILPLGISFFTFTQIAFLIDTYVREAREPRFSNYLLFVTYFPHLIAGPILHHTEMMPQFERRDSGSISENIAAGLSIFVIGLFKKVVIADSVAAFAAPGFDGVHDGAVLSLIEAWSAPIAYTFQLYFDFSGYSDMAIGLSLMFGIRLPLNFDSPLRARSIIEFWQRWHMTLTRYLRLYLYTPIVTKIMSWRIEHGYGISRQDMRSLGGFTAMVAAPLFYTMGLAGIWHGAGLQFLVFGLLHSAYLTVNHGWRTFRRPSRPSRAFTAKLLVLRDVSLTFLAVVVANVFFRASSVHDAWSILRSMAGLNGFVLPAGLTAYLGPVAAPFAHLGVRFEPALPFFYGSGEVAAFALLFFIVWALPNTQQLIARFSPAFDNGIADQARDPPLLAKIRSVRWLVEWRPNISSAVLVGALAAIACLNLNHVSEFLYFEF